MRGATIYTDQAHITNWDFYSHAPCGARQACVEVATAYVEFLLTRPMRGATKDWAVYDEGWEISTHTPHAGRDISASAL